MVKYLRDENLPKYRKTGETGMVANYHTHTWRCKHAWGEEKEYVESAIAGGLKILGFSDHTPMPYADGYVSNVKMDIGQLEDYVDTVLRLKAEYQKDIEIHLGLEVEYYPRYFDELLRITGEYPIEYFLLAQHYLGNETDDFFCGKPTDDKERLRRYCEQSKEALKTGRFVCFAHPDLLNFTGDEESYEREMRELCIFANKVNIPLEINFLGLWSKRHYPNRRFWKIAGEVGNTVIFGADAHRPEDVWRPEDVSAAEKIVKEYQLQLVDTLKLHRCIN